VIVQYLSSKAGLVTGRSLPELCRDRYSGPVRWFLWVQAEIVALIRRLVAEDGMTLLFISHDIALAAELAERIAVFRHGQLVELGATAQIVDAPTQAYTRTLLDAHIGLDAAPLLNRAGLPA